MRRAHYRALDGGLQDHGVRCVTIQGVIHNSGVRVNVGLFCLCALYLVQFQDCHFERMVLYGVETGGCAFEEVWMDVRTAYRIYVFWLDLTVPKCSVVEGAVLDFVHVALLTFSFGLAACFTCFGRMFQDRLGFSIFVLLPVTIGNGKGSHLETCQEPKLSRTASI